MKNKTEFYRASLVVNYEGLCVNFDRWTSFHESECFAWCVGDYYTGKSFGISDNSKTIVKDVKAVMPVKRIDKRFSRFASTSKELAVEQLKIRKTKHISHMKREIEFANAFLNNSVKPFGHDDTLIVSDTQDLVNSHFLFD